MKFDTNTPTLRQIKKNKKATFKPTLASPFAIRWAYGTDEKQEAIYEALQKRLERYEIKRENSGNFVGNSNGNSNSDGNDIKGSGKMKTTKKNMGSIGSSGMDRKRNLKKIKSKICLKLMKKDFFMGLNEVTSGLEKDEVEVVLVCRDIRPNLVLQHLPVLCKLKNVAMFPLVDGSDRLRNLVGAPCIALAVKRSAISNRNSNNGNGNNDNSNNDNNNNDIDNSLLLTFVETVKNNSPNISDSVPFIPQPNVTPIAGGKEQHQHQQQDSKSTESPMISLQPCNILKVEKKRT